jgi:hypothetical protein
MKKETKILVGIGLVAVIAYIWKQKNKNVVNISGKKYIPVSKSGKIIKDDRGQWAHPYEITEINSNIITMKGVNYPLLGISDVGDVKIMLPNKDYKFKGRKVIEYPLMPL